MSKCTHPTDKVILVQFYSDSNAPRLFRCTLCDKELIPNGWLESSYPKVTVQAAADYDIGKGVFKDTAKPVTRLEVLMALEDVKNELNSAMAAFPPMNSAHEGFAVIQEEFNRELWQHVCTNQKARDLKGMRKEAIQVAAMAVRFVVDVCNEERGRR